MDRSLESEKDKKRLQWRESKERDGEKERESKGEE